MIIQMKQLIIASVLLFSLTLSATFEEFKAEMQTKVNSIAQEMETIYGRRCQFNIATCQTLSYNQCLGTSQKKCHDAFPKPTECVDGGAYLSESSAVRFPNDVDTNSLTNQEKQFVCTSALVENKFLELDTGRQKRYGKAYIGTSTGAFRSYPTTRQIEGDGCVDYDPRFRPWYVTATSGAKNVILIIDTSGSMSGDRISIAKTAGTAVVNTLSNNDFVGVISFGSSASALFSTKIIRATQSDKTSIISQIDGLSVSGQTNYEAAFRLAFNMLNAASSDEFGAPCNNGENIILFLTDGEPTVGITTSSGLISMIDGYNKQISMFTYALGSGADTTILNALACQYEGIMFQISDSSSSSALATTMRSYYTYISEGVSISSPVWTEPYDDAFGFGRLVTVSMPIYYTEGSIRSILGVAGIDVTVDQISFGMSEEQLIAKLISNAPCQLSNLSACQIQALRGSNTCGVGGCAASGSLISCNDTATNIFTEVMDTGDYKCCGLTIGALVGIIVGVVVVIVIIIVVVVCKYKKAKAERQALEAQGQGQQMQNKNPNPNPNPNPYPPNQFNQPYNQNPNNPYFNQPYR